MKSNLNDKRIAFIGGHFTPALAVLNALQKHGFSNFIWIGAKYSQTHNKNHSLEYLTIQDKNIPFIGMRAGKLWRKFTLKTLLPGIYNTLLIPYGFLRAIAILLKHNPAVVVSFGGYLALPIVVIAKLFGKKVLTHEQTIVSGLTNKLIARFSDIVCVSWEDSLEFFPEDKTVLTGLPIRPELFETNTRKDVFENSLPILYVIGGNQGSNTINWRLLKILPKLLEKMNIIHITGNSTLTNDYQSARSTRNQLSDKLAKRYVVLENANADDYYFYLKSASFVLSRAGANTVAEILAAGKLSVLVPIPWSSNDEQKRNAEMVAKTGLGIIIEQHNELTPEEILEDISKAYGCYSKNIGFNGDKLEDVKKSAKSLINRNAAEKVYSEVAKLVQA